MKDHHKLIKFHLLALAVVAVWGVTFVSTKVLIGAGMHPVAIFFIRFVLAYAGIWLYIFLSGETRRLWFGWKDELVFLILWNLVMEKLGNVTSTNYVYLNPVFTLLTATIFLGEHMTLWAAVGSAAIMAGVIWAGTAHAAPSEG